MIRQGMECDEEEWDLNKKHYLKELKKSNFEKRVFLFIIIGMILLWFFYIRQKMIIDPFWGSNATNEQIARYFGKQIGYSLDKNSD